LIDITERKRAEEMTEFINALNETLRPLSDPEEIKLAAARILGEHLGADRCAYAEIMADENFLEITGDYTSGGTPSIVGRFSVYDLGPEVLRLMRTDNLSVINDVEVEVSNDASLHAFRQAEIQALVCMPITKRGHFVARMSVQQKTPRRWLPEEVELIKVVANRCWESVARARALRSLRESDDRYRAFIAQSSEAIWRYEYEKPVPVSLPEDEQIEMFYQFSYLAECNDAMAKAFGYDSADQIIGARLGDLIAQPDPMNISFFREFKRAGYCLTNYETRGVDRRGNTKYFLNNLTGIVENGAVVRIWGTSQDITKRKRAEEALRVSEEHARRQLAQIEAIYASAPVGLCFVDAEQRFININNLLAEINGIPVEKHIGRTVREILPDAADTLEPVFRHVIETGEPSMNIEQSLATDAQPGVLRHFIASFYPIKNGCGRALGVNVVVMEITQRKKIEEELERLLRQEKAARADAEAANRMKDEFLATISHELRTPLTSILGWARMLIQGGLTAPQSRHALEVIAQSAQSQNRLIDDILDTSRIVTGRLKLDAQPVEIEHIFHAAVDIVRPSAEAKGIFLSEAVDIPNGVVFGDASRLQQAVWNLLSNAVKFTGEGGRIEARLGRADGQIEIAVKDTGIGVDPGFLPHVFELFRQADASSTREYGGLGFGLSIVRRIVEMHGGDVSASSPGKGQGATFNIRLPLMSTPRQPSPESPRDEAPPPKERMENGHKLEGVRLLVVEDHMETLEMLKFIFDESGAEVITATSVEEALDALDRFKPDALVSDIAMPDRNGYDLILEIRSREPERGGKIPAVAVTAYSRAEDRIRVLAAGFQMHITKPINPDELIAMVASLTGHIHY
jgi:PAS domain S-box-containing protein